jgi:DNA-binding NarL/FixJ family response regulator
MTKVRILLADDHETVREGLKAILNAQEDMEVVGEADDGDAAVSGAVEYQPDIVVMDISMPRLNGLEATRRVRSSCPHCKVLTLTRHSDAGFVDQLLRAGASGYVLKQSRSTELLSAIRAIAAGRTYVDPVIRREAVVRPPRIAELPVDNGARLSSREEEVVKLVAWGYSNKEIASRLDLSVKTIESHKSNAAQKLGIRSRIDIVRYALLRGWLRDV